MVNSWDAYLCEILNEIFKLRETEATCRITGGAKGHPDTLHTGSNRKIKVLSNTQICWDRQHCVNEGRGRS